MSQSLHTRLIAGSLMLCLCCTASAIAQPSNDSCATPMNLPCNSSATVNNTTATQDASDPPFSCHFDGPTTRGFGTIWFTFTATHTSARVGTCTSTGTADDTELAVYDGTCGSLVELACGEDECGGNGLLSRVCVEGLTIGNTYYVQVGSYRQSDTGPVTVTLDCPCPAPPVIPETCETAQALTLPTDLIEIDNNNAASSSTPPFGTCNSGAAVAVQNDIWYTFTTGHDDCILTMTLDTSYDALAIVYTGDCIGLSELDCFDDDIDATHFVNATANTTYWIRIGDWGVGEGGGQTLFSLSCPTDLPTGACCSIIDGACFEADQIECESSNSTYLGDGTTCATGPCISACCLPDFTCTNVTGLVTGLPEGDCSHLGGNWLGVGTSCETNGCPPPNEDCTSVEVLTIPASISFRNDGAIASSVGSSGACNDATATEVQNDVWYTFTTGEGACDLNIQFEADYDLIGIVYSGQDCLNLTELACTTFPDFPLQVQIPGEPNTTYWIRVGDWGLFEGGGLTNMEVSCIQTCAACTGDANGDTLVNGADVQDFTDCYVLGGLDCGCSDVNRDGNVDTADVPLFVDALLNRTGICNNVCDLDSNGQLPALDNAFRSDGVLFQGADNFRAAANDNITHVRWWGVYESDTCPANGDDITITYLNDNNGRPGTVKAGPFSVSAARTETGRLLLGFAPEFLYKASHAPVAVAADECVWISIVNTHASDGCSWFWSLSSQGDGFLASSNVPGTWTASSRQEGDHAWCLDIELSPVVCEALGACCLPGQICDDTTETACTGVWNYGESCATFSCVDLPTDDCASAPLLPCNATVTFDNSDATSTPDEPGFSCHFTGPGTQGLGSVWYRFIATDTTARVGTCDSLVEDTEIAVYDGTCDSLVELSCGEDECGGGFQLLSEVCVRGLTIGNTYFIQIASFSAASQGPITLTLTCPSGCPDNDECIDATPVSCGDSILFDNSLAGPSVNDAPSPNDPDPSCSFEGNPAQATVWFKFTGDGQNWTIQSCNTANVPASIGDTTVSVWVGECGALSEVACGEDDCFGGNVADQGGVPEQWMSSVTVPTILGDQYWIMWSQGFGDRGEILMDISCAP